MRSKAFFLSLFVLPLASEWCFGDDRGLIRIDALNDMMPRIALVIGNADYGSAPLRNPINDARDIASTLRALDFEVDLVLDADQRDMKDAIHRFIRRLSNGSVGLFYFAGHGIQIKGRNFLIPIKVTIAAEYEVGYEYIDVGLLLDGMAAAGDQINIVILDACRNNPFIRRFSTSSLGLASMDAPSNTLIAYATAPGRVALDGPGRNGLYTEYLLAAMRQKELSIEQIFKRVRREVERDTNGQQIPWELSSLKTEFYFTKALTRSESDYDEQLDIATWNSVSGQCNRQMYQIYLNKFPTGRFAELARIKLEDLDQWDSTVANLSPDSCTDYLRLFPKGCFAYQAQNCLSTTPRRESTRYFNVVDVTYNDVLNMRESPNPKARIVGKIPPDSRCITYLGQDRFQLTNRWIKVRYRDSTGWVNAHYLKSIGPDTFEIVNVEPWDVLNMRIKADYRSTKVGEIPPGGICKAASSALTNQRRWVLVEYNGRQGWVNSRYLRNADGCR